LRDFPKNRNQELSGSVRAGLSGSVWMASTSVALGAVSFFFLVVGSRVIDESDFAKFLAGWALVNTVVLTCALPLEQISPRWFAGGTRCLTAMGLGYLLIVLSGGIAVSYSFIKSGDRSFHLSLALFVAGWGLFFSIRIGAIGYGRFKGLAGISLLKFSLICVGVTFLVSTGRASTSGFLVVAALAAAAASLPMGIQLIGSESGNRSRTPVAEFKLLASMTFAIFSQLLLMNGPILLASSWGVPDDKVVMYVALLAVVRTPISLLNSGLAPANIQFVQLVQADRLKDLRRLIRFILLLILVVIGFGTIMMFALGEFLTRLLLGEEFHFSFLLGCGVLLAEGCNWMSSAIRLAATSLGMTRELAVASMLGILVFFLMAILNFDGTILLVLAPVLGAAVVLAAGLVLLDRRLRSP